MSNRPIDVKVTVFKMVSGESCRFDVIRPGDQSKLAFMTVFSALKADDCERLSDGLKRIFLKESPDGETADLVRLISDKIKREVVAELQRAGGLTFATRSYRGFAQAELSEYTSDDYSRDGVTVVLHLDKGDEFGMRVFAPGFNPSGREGGCIESYAKRPTRFLGALLDCFVRKEDMRLALARLRRQEADGS